MSDGHSFYPTFALLNEVYHGTSAHEETAWAEAKVDEEISRWGCSQYEDYLDEARQWESSEMHHREKERLTQLIDRIHQLLTPYVDTDIWDDDIWTEGEPRNVRDVYSLDLDYAYDDTHFLASMQLELNNFGDFGPEYTGRKNYDTVGGELVGRLLDPVEYDELILNLKQVLKAIDQYLLPDMQHRPDETVQQKKRVFVDMDNVLVDFASGLAQVSEEVKQEYEGRLDEIPGLFGLMRPMPGAIDAMHQLQQRYDLFILSTAPWKNPSAWSDKVIWVTRYLDDVFHKRMVITHRKDLCQGDYLIDDRGKNGTSEFAGEWIEFGSERFPDWDSVLRYLM